MQLDRTAFRDPRIDKLNSWQEALLHRILIYVGDGDEMCADPKFIRDTLLPLKQNLRTSQVDSALKALVSANLIGIIEKEGRPYLWIIRPEKPYSGSDVRPGGETSRRGGKEYNIYNKGDIRKTEENEDTDKTKLGVSDEFGITDEEVDKHRKTIDRIEREAAEYGLNSSVGSLRYAMTLVAEYGEEAVIEAIHQCIDIPKWNYVGGILRTARIEGRNPGDPPKRKRTREIINDDCEGTEINKWWGELDG